MINERRLLVDSTREIILLCNLSFSRDSKL